MCCAEEKNCYKLFCVRIYEVDATDESNIENSATMFTVQKDLIDAQQHAIEFMKEKTGNELWSVAEAQVIEFVEGWMIELQPTAILEKALASKQEEDVAKTEVSSCSGCSCCGSAKQ